MTPPLDAPVRDLLLMTGTRLSNWRALKASISRRHAPDFTVFDFVKSNEVGLSSLLRWMLDPHESHGQGDCFLLDFILRFVRDERLPWSGALRAAAATARTEVATHTIARAQRRLDVLIRLGEHAIAIENKPWASWQPDQVADYLRDLDNRAPAGSCLIIFAGSDEELPDHAIRADVQHVQEAAGRLRPFNYTALRDWVVACARNCEAIQVRLMLEDFGKFIERAFGAATDSEELAMIIDPILQDPLLLESALRLIEAGDQIYDRLWDNLAQRIRELASTANWKAVSDTPVPGLFSRMDYHLLLDANLPERLLIGIGYSYQEDWPFIGVCWNGKSGSRAALAADFEALSTQCGSTEDSDKFWPWWGWLGHDELGLDREDSLDFWTSLAANERAAQAIIARVRRIRAAFRA